MCVFLPKPMCEEYMYLCMCLGGRGLTLKSLPQLFSTLLNNSPSYLLKQSLSS